MPIHKSVFLLNLLEIKRKYTELRQLCKSENLKIPSYNTISEYRKYYTTKRISIYQEAKG